ncbi:hypothetical protein K525DRAFT_274777 [Schizophyllum commune Loenen D]|nr:hypothetical protein K525DRAFT_274777 [Schizophyllum commune Loenen D]
MGVVYYPDITNSILLSFLPAALPSGFVEGMIVWSGSQMGVHIGDVIAFELRHALSFWAPS